MMRYKTGPYWYDDEHKAAWERDPDNNPPIYISREFTHKQLEKAARLDKEHDSPEEMTDELGVLNALLWLSRHRHLPDVPSEYVDNAP